MAKAALAKVATLDEALEEMVKLLRLRIKLSRAHRDGEEQACLQSGRVERGCHRRRKYEMLYFAGLLLQKEFVGFYFMPIHMDPELQERVSPALLKLLKGKSCFQVRALTPELRKPSKKRW